MEQGLPLFCGVNLPLYYHHPCPDDPDTYCTLAYSLGPLERPPNKLRGQWGPASYGANKGQEEKRARGIPVQNSYSAYNVFNMVCSSLKISQILLAASLLPLLPILHEKSDNKKSSFFAEAGCPFQNPFWFVEKPDVVSVFDENGEMVPHKLRVMWGRMENFKCVDYFQVSLDASPTLQYLGLNTF